MRVARRVTVAVAVAGAGLAVTALGCVALGLAPADYHPAIDPASFAAPTDNPYYPLVPGTTYRYVEKARGETSENEITVTRETKSILGVRCLTVHDVVVKDGEVTEETDHWIASDREGAVWSFGEATREISPAGAISTEGSWQAGVAGAQPGILMPANPSHGVTYRQGYSLGVAEDMAEVDALGDTVTVPAGQFSDCVRTREWSLLEAGTEIRWYAKGVGFVRSESTGGEVSVLVSITRE
jgi:hypothetical protein